MPSTVPWGNAGNDDETHQPAAGHVSTVSDMVVISYAEFQEYQARRRQPAVEPARPEPSQATEAPSPAVPSDTPPHQEPSSQTR